MNNGVSSILYLKSYRFLRAMWRGAQSHPCTAVHDFSDYKCEPLYIYRREREGGNILVSTMLIMLTMNIMGVGLMQVSIGESRSATYKSIDSEVFHITETCARDIISWLKTQTKPPDALPYVISETDLTHLNIGNETQQELNKLAGYSYTCSLIHNATILSESADDEGDGGEVGSGGSYSSANATPKYYYQIESTGSGPKSSTKTAYTILSVEF